MRRKRTPAAWAVLAAALAAGCIGVPRKEVPLGGLGEVLYYRRPLAAWTRGLRDPDARTRIKAADTLGEIGPDAGPAAVALGEALRDPDRDVRRAAARALGSLGPAARDAVPALAQALKDKSLRKAAVQALGGIGAAARAAVPALAPLLRDPDVRDTVVEALGSIGPAARAAVPALTEVLSVEDASSRTMVLLALTQVDPDACAAAPAFQAALRDDDAQRRWAALLLAARLGPKAKPLLPEFRRCLRHGKPEARAAAADAIGAIGPGAAAAAAALRRALKDNDPRVQLAAAGALASVGEGAAGVRALLAAYDSEEARQAKGWAALGLLGEVTTRGHRFGPAAVGAVPLLVEVVRDEPDAARVLKGLAYGPRARHRDDWRRLYLGWFALEALGGIGPAARDAVPALVEAMEEQPDLLRLEAARALWRVERKPERVLPTLLDPFERRPGAESRPGLPDISDDSASLRGRAAEILIEMGPAAAAAVPKLTRALADPQVRDEALKALAGLGPTARAAVPTLYTLLWSADDDVRVRAYDALQQVRAKGPAPAAK